MNEKPVDPSAQNSARTPIRGRPFPKGMSGNPAGRPKLEREIRRLAQQHSGAALLRMVALMHHSNPRVALAACLAVLERAIGSPPQAITSDEELTAAEYQVFSNKIREIQTDNDVDRRRKNLFRDVL
jgi:hypothetical protein